MLGHQRFDRMADDGRFQIRFKPDLRFEFWRDRSVLFGGCGTIVEVGCITSVLHRAGRIDLNELKLPRNRTVVSSLVNSSILYCVLQIKERPNLLSGIIRVHQHGATFQEISIPIQDEINRCSKQRMPR